MLETILSREKVLSFDIVTLKIYYMDCHLILSHWKYTTWNLVKFIEQNNNIIIIRLDTI